MKSSIRILGILLSLASGVSAADCSPESSVITTKLLDEVHALRLAIEKTSTTNATALIAVELAKMANQKVEYLEQGLEQVKSDISELDELITSDSTKLREVAEKIGGPLGNQEASDLKQEQASLQDMVQRNTKKRYALLERQSNLQMQLGREQSKYNSLQDRLKGLEDGIDNQSLITH